MKKLFPYLISAIVICVAYYFYFQTPATQKAQSTENVLVVGISPDYPPYANIDITTGQIVGLEMDVVTEIAQRLNKTLDIKNMPFNTLIVELAAGQIDIVAAGMTPSPEREKTILFSHPYIDNDDIVIVTKKSNPAITSLEDLYGKQVAVNIGYTSDSFLSKYSEVQLIRLKYPTDGVAALNADSVYAFATSQASFSTFLDNQTQTYEYNFFKLPASADACALAFNKKNTKLQEEINAVIDTMMEDGTMQTIRKKWGFE